MFLARQCEPAAVSSWVTCHDHSCQSHNGAGSEGWIWIPAFTCTSCVNLNKLLNYPAPWFSQMEKQARHAYFVSLSWGVNKTLYVKDLAQCLALDDDSVNNDNVFI